MHTVLEEDQCLIESRQCFSCETIEYFPFELTFPFGSDSRDSLSLVITYDARRRTGMTTEVSIYQNYFVTAMFFSFVVLPVSPIIFWLHRTNMLLLLIMINGVNGYNEYARTRTHAHRIQA